MFKSVLAKKTNNLELTNNNCGPSITIYSEICKGSSIYFIFR